MPFAFLLAALAAAPAESHPVTEALTDVFVSACINGNARLNPATTTKLTWDQLPRPLRNEYREHKHGSFYQITKPSPAYLIVATLPEPSPEGVVMICDLRNEGVDLAAAWSRISSAATGKVPNTYRSGAIHYRMTLPEQRARVLLARKAMRATIFTEAAAAKLRLDCGNQRYVWTC